MTAALIDRVAGIIDLLAVLTLLCGLVLSILAGWRRFARAEGERTARLTSAALITFRITLGRWMLTALEILIVSDVLHSISHRTLDELAILTVIVMIRVAMAYFLDLELTRIERHERRAAEDATAEGDGPAPTESGETEGSRFAQRLANHG